MDTSPKMRLLALMAVLQIAATPPLPSESPAPGDLRSAGEVVFPISCDATVQSEFVRGVALLHSFFYEEARRIFTSVAERDPKCAMAQWGIAMSWWHPIWTPPTPEEMAAGKAAVERAMAMTAPPRERAFIEAINAYYAEPAQASPAGPVGQSCHGPVGPRDRVLAYEQAMRKVYEKHPKDVEARVWYAFAVLSVGYATPTDKELTRQKEAGRMLEALWKKHPHHPGVAHYLIHSYDYPPLAQKALPAAKAYADIAPWVPHALHMPSHIFTRLGMWTESVDSNAASAEASRAYAAQRGRTATEVEELHAYDYMLYSHLQAARDDAARGVLEQAMAVRETFPAMEFVGAYALAAMPARYALEREAWEEAAKLAVPERPQWQRYPFVEALFEYTHALGRARGGDRDGARKAIERMRALREATTEPKFDYFKKHLDLQIQSASAWLAHREGRSDEAVAALRTAADGEDALGKHPVTPGALVPAREQLGEMLLELGRNQEALAAFESALKIYPARFRGLYGAGVAAERSKERKLARRYFTELVKQSEGAQSARSELAHAREYLTPARAGVAGATQASR
jgi:tetratricopeptide (TPR) repeat protein